ncbi:EAL domain-containing protein [Wenzhouxiangella sp. AB-CW3]|uniref:putative bifunctional diguanylate cyclase/phosphodiesterase n=1 Tax=Wenzhouxiangella sp. AB-CW3 TaxID=2771012 RepID=UPI00168C012E|nr:EAL domain-containing protein [Wenzhouxiangella sp. AB-CW3]QOC22403.1 EAL domain-containing protein [Wenzhouxiangella sp. AB-CW3]
MKAKRPDSQEGPRTVARSRPGGAGIRTRLYLLCLVVSLAIVVLVGLSYVGFQALSGARAYVHGESQWAKAQKQAVISLLEYAASGRPVAFEHYREALEVIRGDQRARIALEADRPDIEAAREGFLAGRNHPEDIDLMIRMFRHATHLQEFERAVQVWVEAEWRIEQVEQTAQALRSVVDEQGTEAAAIQSVIEQLLELDRELTILEDRFSLHISRLAHQLTRLVAISMVVLSLLLIVGLSVLGWYLTRKAERDEKALRESEQRYRALVDQPEVGMWHIDPEGRIVYINPAMREMMGVAADLNVSGQSIDQFILAEDRKAIPEDRLRREQGETTTREIRLTDGGGGYRNVLIHGAPVMLAGGRLAGHVGTCVDITDRKRAEEQLRRQAHYDALTGLPNRFLFMDRLEVALRRGRRDGQNLALLFIDLDRFKVINDSLGHVSGDRMLREAAKRIKQAVREVDTIARLGGDEFGLIVENVQYDADGITLADRIIEALRAGFELNRFKSKVSASIGIAISGDSESPADLLRFADIAMYVAKRRGGGQWHIFDPEHDAHEEQRLHLENELWAAAENDELVLHYQPIVDLSKDRVVAVEALLRWQHPRLGLLGPDRFIPIAEENGAIVDIGRWVVDRACRDYVTMKQRLGAKAPTAVCVNISAAEFRLGDPTQWVGSVASEHDLEAGELCFEVTESLLTNSLEVVGELEQQGFPVAIDDFGTGYASLDLLRQVRFSTIKIDRTFIQRVIDSPVDHALVEFILQLAQRLDMKVVAEGVENEQQVELLRGMGLRLAQGYLFSRPVDIDALVQQLESS